MAPTTGTDERYAVAIGELWSSLARTLTRLDVLAGEPVRLEGRDAPTALRRLQYALHLASEHAFGLTPPPGAATAHAELADALACARDATADVAEAASLWGAAGAEPLLHDWRGALFRVRVARVRLAAAPPPLEPPSNEPSREQPDGMQSLAAPIIAFLLALAGAVALVAGATLGIWPVWVLGIVAVCGSIFVYRP